MNTYEEELAVLVGYIMYNDLLKDTRFDGTFFYKIDNVIKLAKAFIEVYPPEFEWGMDSAGGLEYDETIESWVKDNHERILK